MSDNWRTATGALIIGLFLCLTPAADAGRQGEIRLTDGSIYTGEISAKGEFRLVTWAEDELGIEDEEDLDKYGAEGEFRRFYGRERTFELDMVKSIRLEPRPELPSRDKPAERMERRWDWEELARYEDEREEINHEKVFIGEPFPVRELQAVVTFNSGETLAGSLDRAAVYIYPEDSWTAEKFVLRAKEKGEEGESMEDLIHVRSIRFLEEGADFPASHRVEFRTIGPDSPESVWAMTRNTLTRLEPEPVDGQGDEVEISGVYGEGILLALRSEGQFYVGWRNRADETLSQAARHHLEEMRDYYNERRLLGVRDVENSPDVLTLVSLRRHVPETSVREHQPERFGLDSDSSLEFFRIGVWRWRYNQETGKMILVDRGSFFRRELAERGMDTPEVEITPALWLGEEENLPREITVDEEFKEEQ